MDLALNNLQRLICHETQQTKQTKLIRKPPYNTHMLTHTYAHKHSHTHTHTHTQTRIQKLSHRQ